MEDFLSISRELSLPEIPHLEVTPLNVARWINYLEAQPLNGTAITASSSPSSSTTSEQQYCKNLEEFVELFPSVKLLKLPEQYLLYCFMYGRSQELNLYTSSLDMRPEVVEVMRSPVTPDTLQSEANLWSFTPPSTQSRLTPNQSLGVWNNNNNSFPSRRPRSAEPSSSTTSTMQRLFRDNQQMGLPVVRSIDAYSHNSRDDLSSLEYFDDDDESDDFGPVDYDTRRQTEIRTANIKRFSIPSDDEEKEKNLPPVVMHHVVEQDFSPVDYSERRQTNVRTANVMKMESPQIQNKYMKKAITQYPSSNYHSSPQSTTSSPSEGRQYDVVDFESSVEISNQPQQQPHIVNEGNNVIISSSVVRPRLQTEVHQQQQKQQQEKEQLKSKKSKKRDSKKQKKIKQRKGSRKSNDKSDTEKENYRTPSMKRRSGQVADEEDNDPNSLSLY